MRRHILGILALILLLLGLVTLMEDSAVSSAAGISGSCIKSGLVLGALWLALPQILSTFAALPRWAMSRFRKKGKPPESSGGSTTPIAPQPRPRRRSNQSR
jgi:hypothetical protein